MNRQQSPLIDDALLSSAEAAAFLKIHPGTLQNWRCAPASTIPFVRVGKRALYRRADLLAWLAAHTYTNTADERQRSGRLASATAGPVGRAR